MTFDAHDYQEKIESFDDDVLVIVDFFMEYCPYCIKFEPHWNRIVDEMKEKYGDQIQFLLVDGKKRDKATASRYGVEGFPEFISLEPGSKGEKFHTWTPHHRTYQGMSTWIDKLAANYGLKPISSHEIEHH